MRAIKGRVLIKMDVRQKEKVELGSTGILLYVEKNYNFNLREDKSSMAVLIDGIGLKEGVKCLVHHLSSEPSYLINDETLLTKEEYLEGYKVFSIPEDNVFCYSEDGVEWQPCKNFLMTSRMYKPYKGTISGIPNERVEGALYIDKGFDYEGGEEKDLSGNVAMVTPNSDYEIIFVDELHKEHRVIRTRNREIQAIHHNLTDKVKKGEILVGTSDVNCKALFA